MTKIEIPKSVTSIGTFAFNSCDSLTSIKVDPENTKYWSKSNDGIEHNCIVETSGTDQILISGCKNTTIPTSVTSIGEFAFNCRTGLTSIVIPGGVTSIGTAAFHGCTELVTITLGESVTSIGEFAFFECTVLSEIVFNGTSEQYKTIERGVGWNTFVLATEVYCVGDDTTVPIDYE